MRNTQDNSPIIPKSPEKEKPPTEPKQDIPNK